ncbi:ubiquitin-like 1-activating enzyme E1 [Acrasis kona]|uniref:SUMO-activating enzyme subunit n=1 Tax=Acrasis kona TaxID=1008807 RepID=A0AAW2YIA0_9EUKA
MDRYSHIKQIYGDELFNRMQKSKVLVVGAGGIGCELLKNLVLSGYLNIEIIDLDTIDVSNLNRQFLFRQQHVGQSKAVIAKETALRFNPAANINAHHGSIYSSEFGLDYFRQFDVVLNALDNVDARRHVNRMCLATGIVMIDGGTAGYRGQVNSYQKGLTECYECATKATQKTYAICTIRSNPSTAVHCIVWSKLLFERLFGKIDEANSISDFEILFQEKHKNSLDFARKVFEKVFVQDIKKLTELTEENADKKDTMWNSGKAPEPVPFSDETSNTNTAAAAATDDALEEQRVWSLQENISQFLSKCAALHDRKTSQQSDLSFDKDDDEALQFVTAAANLRCFNFHIKDAKSIFDTKAIAGNIVPAIATSNAVIAGMLVLELTKVISAHDSENKVSSCRTLAGYLQDPPMLKRKKAPVFAMPLPPPNPKCFVCSSNYVTVTLNAKQTKLDYFVKRVLLEKLGLREPMVYLGSKLLYEHSGDGSDDDDDEMAQVFKNNLNKNLTDLGVTDQCVLNVSDGAVDVDWSVRISHDGVLDLDEFKFEGDTESKVVAAALGEDEKKIPEEDDDDMVVWTEDEKRKAKENKQKRGLKRKRDGEEEERQSKVAKVDVVEID